jgi:hypothetical protein
MRKGGFPPLPSYHFIMEENLDSEFDYTDSECDSECEYGADIHDPKDDSDSDLEFEAPLEAPLKAPLEAQSHASTKSGPSTTDVLKRSGLPPTGLKTRQSRHSIGHRQWALILYA